MEEQWIKSLREKMADYTTSPPEGLWEQIDAAMQKKEASSGTDSKRVFLWLMGISSVAAMIALVLWIGSGEAPDPVVPSGRIPLAQVEEDDSVLQAEPSLPESLAVVPSVRPRDGNRQMPDVPQLADLLSVVEEEVTLTSVEPIVSQEKPEKTSRKRDYGPALPKKRDRSYTANHPSVTHTEKNAWTVGLYASNLSNATDRQRGYGELVYGSILPEEEGLLQGNDPITEILYSNLGQETHTKREHKQPVKIGFSFRYPISRRFSLESGLTYSYLSSQLTSGTDQNRYETRQSLQYLGIPLNMHFDIWEHKRWVVYLSGGGMIEKCISCKSLTDYILEGKISSTTREKVRVKPLQYSVNAAAGVQFNLSSHFGFYAEPGVNYYFDNGSPVETLYKDQPLNFNLRLGLRYSFK